MPNLSMLVLLLAVHSYAATPTLRFGISLDFGDDDALLAAAGVRTAFGKSNAAGGILGTGAMLELVTLDDMGNADNVANNTRVMVENMRVLGLVSYLGDGRSLANVVSSLPVNLPFISPITGSSLVREPFRSHIINIRASSYEEMAQLVAWATANDAQRIGVVSQRDCAEAVDMAGQLEIAMRQRGMRTKGNVTVDSTTLAVDLATAASAMMNQTVARNARPPSAIFVLAKTALAARIIDAFKPVFPTSLFFATSLASPPALAATMTMAPSNVYVSSVVPPVYNNMTTLTGPRYPLEVAFSNAVAGNPWLSNTRGFEGFLAGQFLVKVLENIEDGNVTGQSILDTIYSMQMISISRMRLGLFCYDNTCSSPCNQGMRRIYITGLTAARKMSLTREASFATCGVAPVLSAPPLVFGVSSFLRAYALGMRAAFEQMNKVGGVNRRMIYTLGYNDLYSTPNAIFNAKELIADDDVFAVGCYLGTEIGLKVTELLDTINAQRPKDPIAFFGPYTGGQAVRVPARKYVINVRGSFYDEMETAVAYFFNLGVDLSKSVALVQSDDFGMDNLAGVNLALQKRGITGVMAYATYDKLTNDPSDAMRRLNATFVQPTIVFLLGTSGPASVFMKNLQPYYPPDCYWVSPSSGTNGYFGINNITSRLYGVQAVPLPRGAIKGVFLDSYQDALTNLFAQPLYRVMLGDSSLRDSMIGLEGFVVGTLIVNALQRISLGEPMTRDSFLNKFYTTGAFNLGSTMTVGPWSEECVAGLVTLFMVNVTANLTFQQVPQATRTILRTCTPAPAVYIRGENIIKNNTEVAIGVSVGMVIVLIALAIIAVVMYRRKRMRYVIDTKGKGIITFDELTCKKSVGMGSFGEVFLGDWAGSEVAIKKLIKNEMSPKQLKEFVGETALMFELRHPNIVLFMGVCTEVPNLCIVTEFMHRGSLFDILHKTYLIEQPMMLKFARDVCAGLAYLHQRNVTHRDMKSLNVLVSRDWTAKVSDFGMSQLKDSEQDEEEKMGTVLWSSPETLRQEKATKKSDVYSYGVILWEIYTRRVPWDGFNQNAVTVKVLAGQMLERTASVPPGIDSLMVSCWHSNFEDRPTAADILAALEEMEDPHGQLILPILAEAPPAVANPVSGAQVYIPNLAKHYTQHPVMIDAAVRIIERIVTAARKHANGFEVLADGESFRVLFHGPRFAMSFCNRVREELLRLPWDPNSIDAPRSPARLETEASPSQLETPLSERPKIEALFSPRDDGAALPLSQSLASLIALSAHYARASLVTEGPQKGAYSGSIISGLELLKSKVSPGGAHASVDLLNEVPEQEVLSDEPVAVNQGGETIYVRAFLPGPAIGKGSGSDEAPDPAAWFAHVNNIVFQSGPDDRIGMGTYSIAMRATWQGSNVVFKKLINQNLNVEQLLDMRLEAAIVRRITHPNVLAITAACTFCPRAGFIVPLMSRGNLHDMLGPKSASRPELARRRLAVVRQIAAGLASLHQHQVVHGSLKTSNILIDNDWSVSISDYGFAKLKLSMATMTSCDKATWMSPEIAQGAGTTLPGDVFSFAMIFWSLCHMVEPFQHENGFAALMKVIKGVRPDISARVHPDIAALITACWDQTPANRPLMAAVLSRLGDARDDCLDSA